MSSSGQQVYASLAQLSVKGMANALLEKHAADKADPFQSAFLTAHSFATAFIRSGSTRQELNEEITRSNSGTVTFVPPKALDVLHSVFLVLELPGLTTFVDDGLGAATSVREVCPQVGGVDQRNTYTVTTDAGGLPSIVVHDASGNAGDPAFNTSYIDVSTGATISGNANTTATCVLDDDKASDCLGASAAYKNGVGFWAVRECTLMIGGTPIDTLTADLLFIDNEIHGKPSQFPHNEYLHGKCSAEGFQQQESTKKRRLYVPLNYWFCGGSLSNALKLISMQLHEVKFRLTFRSMSELIIVPTANATSHTLGDGTALAGASISVESRNGDQIGAGPANRLIGEVRSGNALNRFDRDANPTRQAYPTGAFCMDFHGCFLSKSLRAKYLNLDAQILFTNNQVLPINIRNQAVQTETLDLKNAVYEVVVGVRNKRRENGDNWGFDGVADTSAAAADLTLAEEDVHPIQASELRGFDMEDPLETLSFSISSTPRTEQKKEGQYFRTVYPYLVDGCSTMSKNKGIYYWPIHLQDKFHGTKLVSGMINASKIDDMRMTFQLNTRNLDAAGAGAMTRTSADYDVQVFAKADNLMTIRGGMAGKLFQ